MYREDTIEWLDYFYGLDSPGPRRGFRHLHATLRGMCTQVVGCNEYRAIFTINGLPHERVISVVQMEYLLNVMACFE